MLHKYFNSSTEVIKPKYKNKYNYYNIFIDINAKGINYDAII